MAEDKNRPIVVEDEWEKACRAALRDAAATFRLYEAEHKRKAEVALDYSKELESTAKAKRNGAMAARLEALL